MKRIGRHYGLPIFLIQIQIVIGWIIQKLSFIGESGAMTGTIPTMLLRIPLKGTAHVRTPGLCGSQKIHGCFQRVASKLRMENTAGRGEYFCIGILFALNTIAQNGCCNHGRGDAPFIKAGGYIHVCGFG
jgi:hypothetical protein